MIVVKLMGGMGNQLFQYALGRSLSARNRAPFKMDISGYEHQPPECTPRQYDLDHFNVQESFASQQEVEKLTGQGQSPAAGRVQRLLLRLIGGRKKTYVTEPSFAFNPEILEAGSNVYLVGYWQTEKYFQDIVADIRREFTLKPEFSVDDKDIARRIKAANGRSSGGGGDGAAVAPTAVSLHIRRGDYVSDAATNKFHGCCTLDYYAAAMKIVAGQVAAPHFFVFSDDIEWVRSNLKFHHPVTYVSDGQLKDYEELTLMSYCQHHILANSSFSWWGAWLNPNPGKIVVAPKKWFNEGSMDTRDLIPEGWMRI